MPKAEFARINAEREEAGLPLYANPRNSGAGSLRQIDPPVTASRQAVGLVLPAGRGRRRRSTTQSAALERLAALGFPVNPERAAGLDIEGVIAFTERWREARHDAAVRDRRRRRQGRPRSTSRRGSGWSAARRAGRSRSSSRRSRSRPFVEDIVPYVGRTGTLTPVAHLTPIKVAGSTVARATLHNLDEVRRKDIRIGDWVVLQKAGDVIPEVVRPIVERRTGAEREFEMPARCPVCGTPVVQDEGAVRVYCPNTALPGARRPGVRPLRRARRDGHRGGRLGGPVAAPRARAWSTSRADFFRLTVEDLETLDRFAREERREPARGRIERARVGRPLGAGHQRPRACPQVGEQTAIDLATWLAERVRPTTTRRPMATMCRIHGSPRSRPSCGGSRSTSRNASTEVAGDRPDGRGRARPLVRRRGDRATSSTTWSTVGVEPERPVVRPAGEASARAARRQDARRDRHARGLHPPGGGGGDPRGRRQGRPARSRRRRTTWSPARAPARSWPRPRSSACRSSTRRGSGACWRARTPDGVAPRAGA